MDKELLVKSGQALLNQLDQTKAKPAAALWVYNPDNDIWRLWIVTKNKIQEDEFYRIVAKKISENRESLGGIDIGSIELIDKDHPAIKGSGAAFRIEGISSVFVSNNKFNGFFLPDGIILRMAI